MHLTNYLSVEIVNFLRDLADDFTDIYDDVNPDYYDILAKVFYVLAPLLATVVIYQYIKYTIVLNAHQYEKSVRKRCGHMKKMSKRLKVMVKRYGNFYFRYMPMSHGMTLPQTYPLFTAIKEVLTATNRPATRGVRMNFLFDLMHGPSHESTQQVSPFEMSLTQDGYDDVPGELDPLSDYNHNIMKCSRELIIQGIKDFEVMFTLFRVLETVMEEADD